MVVRCRSSVVKSSSCAKIHLRWSIEIVGRLCCKWLLNFDVDRLRRARQVEEELQKSSEKKKILQKVLNQCVKKYLDTFEDPQWSPSRHVDVISE